MIGLLKDFIQMSRKGQVWVKKFNNWRQSVPELLDKTGLITALDNEKRLLIKPNLVEVLAPPITTPVGIVEALVEYLKERAPNLEVVVGEGCGARQHDTFYAFDELGYSAMAARQNIELVDLNVEELIRRELAECKRWPEMYLPKIVYESFLFSVPVLKAHSLASVTLTMKNMMGCAPPCHYQKGGHWKKASFHENVQEAVLDLNRYRSADFTLLDATVGMARAHLWGPTCEPPVNKLVAGYDPVAVDAFGAELLGRNWRQINHINLADGELGRAEPLEVVEG